MVAQLKKLIIRYRDEKNPNERLALSLKLTFNFLNTDPNLAFQFLTQAEVIAQLIGSKEGYAESIRLKGLYYFVTEKYTDAYEQINKSLSLYRDLPNDAGIVKCLINLGLLYAKENEYPKALDIYSQALKDIKVNKLPAHFHSSCLNNMSMVYERLGNFKKALEFSNKAIDVCSKADLLVEAISPKANTALYLLKLGQYDLALPMFHKLMDEYEENFDKQNKALTLSNLGLIYYEIGDNNNSLNYYQKALKAQRLTNNRRGMANALNGLGKLFTRLRGFDEASIYLLRSLSIMEELKELDGKCSVLLSLGLNSFSANKLSNAEHYLKQCVAIAEELGLADQLSNALKCLIEIAKRMEDETSQTKYKMMLKNLTKIKNAESN